MSSDFLPGFLRMFFHRLRPFVLLTALVFIPAGLFAQTVALGRFSHADHERNDPGTTNTNMELLLARLGADTSYQFVERASVERLIAEQALTREGFARADGAARLGRLLGTDLLLCGTFLTPSPGSTTLVLEVIEPARAETVALARLDLGPVLRRGHLAPLSPSDIEAVSRATAPLLASGWREIQDRPNQVLLKLLALPNLTGNPVYDGMGARLEKALNPLAAATPRQRLLRTLRPDIATQESELFLLGLVQADVEAWSRLADHYLVGSCEITPSGPVLGVELWDGVSAPRTLSYPLPAGVVELGPFLTGVSHEILGLTQAGTRRARSSSTGQTERARLAAVLLGKAKAMAAPASTSSAPILPPSLALSLTEAARLAACAIFLDPGRRENWTCLAGIRDQETALHQGNIRALHLAAAVEFKYSIIPRFILRPSGEADADTFSSIPWFSETSLQTALAEVRQSGENFSDIYQGHNLLLLAKHLETDIQMQLNRAADLLAASAIGKDGDDKYFRASVALLGHVLGGPVSTEHQVRLIGRLWPRMKTAYFVHQSWLHDPGFSDLPIRLGEPFFQLGRFDEAKSMEVLSSAELAVSLASLPGHLTPGTDRRRQVEAYLRARSVEAPDPRQAFSSPLPKPRLPGAYPPLEAYAPAERAKHTATLLASYEKAAAEGYPAGVLERLRATVQAWAAATGPAPSLAPGVTPPEQAPTYLGLADAESVLRAAAIEGDLSELAGLFDLGAPVEASGFAFVAAIQMRQWPAVEYLLHRGYNPGRPWPMSSRFYLLRKSYWPPKIEAKDTGGMGAVALVEAAWSGRRELVDRLIALGAKPAQGSALTDAMLHRLVRANEPEILRSVLRLDPIPHPEQRQSRPSYLREAVARKDIVILRLLLAAHARPQEHPGGMVQINGGLVRSEQWEVDMERMLGECSITYAARQNWREGIEAMLAAPALDRSEAFEQWPHSVATDPATRALLVRATLEATLPDARSQASGIALLAAISGDDAAMVATLWKSPAVRHIRFRGQSPLAFAIVENRPTIARFLVGQGARLDDLDEAGVTPLARAAALGDVELVRFLAGKGADLNLQRDKGNTPLGHAIYSNQEATALALLDLGASLKAPAALPSLAPLIQATRRNQLKVVARLLELGADPRTIVEGYSIFFPAAISNNPELIQRFVDLGCDLDRRNPAGWTPLVSAVRWGADESTAKLLALGVRDPLAADTVVNIIKNDSPELRPEPAALRALHYRPDYRRCLELLEEAKQIADSPAAQNRIFWEQFIGKTETEVAGFLKNGGDVNFRGAYTPLQAAISHSGYERDEALSLAWVKFLLAHGADTEATGSESYQTPLRLAISRRGKTEVVRVLLAHGARWDAMPVVRFAYISSILADAISHPQGEPAVVRLLLDHGAPIDEDSVASFERLRSNHPTRVPLLEAILTPAELARLRGGR